MKFILFVDYSLQELKVLFDKSEESGTPDLRIQAKVNALRAILIGYQWAYKWTLVPKMIILYFAVYLGLRKEPVPVISNKRKADAETKKAVAKLAAKNPKTNGSESLSGKKEDKLTEAGEFHQN